MTRANAEMIASLLEIFDTCREDAERALALCDGAYGVARHLAQLAIDGKPVDDARRAELRQLVPAMDSALEASATLRKKLEDSATRVGRIRRIVAIKGLISYFATLHAAFTSVLGSLLEIAAKLPGGVGQKFGEMATTLKQHSADTMAYVKGLWTETDHVATSAPKAGAALRGFGGDAEEAGRKLASLKEKVHDIEQGVHGIIPEIFKAVMPLEEWTKANEEGAKRMQVAWEEHFGVLERTIPVVHDWWAILNQTGGDVLPVLTSRTIAFTSSLIGLEKTGSLVHSIAEGLKSLPQILQQAFTGGGGLGGALNALGAKIGGDLFSEGGPFAKAAKAATGGLTSLFGKTIGGALGAAIPGIGALIGPGLEALWGGIKKLFGGPSEEELGARAAFQKLQVAGESLNQTIDRMAGQLTKAGKTGPQALSMIQRVLDATHQSAEAVNSAFADIQATLDTYAQDQADLQAAIEKYKFSIEELGPAMQKQQLDDQAQQLIRDWTLLVDSGINVATVNEHMASTMNDYLKLARDTGQEVPQAMEPILQKMIDQGLLTDDAGAKITDLKDLGVDFSMTMSEGFKKVVDKLQELLDRLGKVPDAISAIPTSIDIAANVQWNVPPPPDFANMLPPGVDIPGMSRGGLVTMNGVLYAAQGTVVPFIPRGTDTVPAMLSPGETVRTRAQEAGLQASVLNFRDMKENYEALKQEVRGLRTDMSRRIPQLVALQTASAVAQARKRA